MVNEEAWKEIENFIFIGEERMQPADLMIVPGAPQELLAHHAAELYREGYAGTVLVSGKFSYRRQSFAEEWKAHQEVEDAGSGGNTGVDPASYQTESAWLKALMVREGVPESAIWTEEESTNTFENARFCRKLLESKEIGRAHV